MKNIIEVIDRAGKTYSTSKLGPINLMVAARSARAPFKLLVNGWEISADEVSKLAKCERFSSKATPEARVLGEQLATELRNYAADMPARVIPAVWTKSPRVGFVISSDVSDDVVAAFNAACERVGLAWYYGLQDRGRNMTAYELGYFTERLAVLEQRGWKLELTGDVPDFRTPKEIEELKVEWLANRGKSYRHPGDIEDSWGWALYAPVLKKWRKEIEAAEAEAKAAEDKRLADRAEKLGSRGNLQLAILVEGLEAEIAALKARITVLEADTIPLAA
ncbi:hypothetical protein GFM44_23360 [Rhizobium leguminosarum bv. viciae]|nr:hypothetical protein [Rhizobium leguminosarum bv. viciae]